ncbi:acyl-CoA dehydrogenase family protein [Luteimicrobium xylanilyticum]|uniref:Medium-chain acyl-CoA dehydrogenase n=1 Tax=Luteimicrobium xylanilyticum TaxID=1133546 RepID=A0A5P9Q5P3_9MICO|nr:acyl-CoA dehydrogenase family protein [Luteimicrobium xylanilyticum]QFU96693.1 Medium-chain acyl-CoA dehydrogenase [Luteimicrobium xylanilyticum]
MITETHGLTDEQLKLAATVRDFADEVVAPAAYQYDTERRLPIEIIRQMGDLGLFGLPFPVEVGGQGKDYVSLCLAVEALARVDQSIAVTLEAGVGLGVMPIYRHGTEAQRERWLPDLVSGRALGAFGLTEAEAGSDAGATRTTARLEDGTWVIDGSKQFITNSGTPITSVITITAVTGDPGTGRKELSSFLVPAGTPGLAVGPDYDKVGWHTSDTHPLTLTGVRVPDENLLGERGRGYANFLHVLDEGRVAFAALASGAAQGCLEEALRYAGTRTVFGSSIGSHQHVAFMLARMEARAHSARLCWFDAAQKLVHGEPFKAEASVAKLVASEAAMANARDAAQIFGGYGFLNENPVARHYRDAKVLEIGEGTTEVQLMILARDLGLTA